MKSPSAQRCQHQTRANRHTIHDDRARTAGAMFAAQMRGGEAAAVADEVGERGARDLAVDRPVATRARVRRLAGMPEGVAAPESHLVPALDERDVVGALIGVGPEDPGGGGAGGSLAAP